MQKVIQIPILRWFSRFRTIVRYMGGGGTNREATEDNSAQQGAALEGDTLGSTLASEQLVIRTK